MKKQFTYLVIGIAVVGMVSVADAQVAQPASVTAPTPQVAPLAPKATATPVMTKKEKLQEAVKKLEQSLEVRIANLDGLATRIQSRIVKMQAEGKDMTAASAKLAEAQKAIAAAKTELTNLKKADTAMVTSAKPATAFTNIKNKSAKNVVAKIKAAHKALVDTIIIIKMQGLAAPVTPTVQ